MDLFAFLQGFHWQNGNLIYALPLIISISLVYGATKHERMKAILAHAGHTALCIVGFMTAVLAILAFLSWCA
jgi:hypothetical protein